MSDYDQYTKYTDFFKIDIVVIRDHGDVQVDYYLDDLLDRTLTGVADASQLYRWHMDWTRQGYKHTDYSL